MGCTAFIVIPWIANMVSLSKYQQRWCKDDAIRERVYSWFVSWQRLTYALAAISGSAFGTVELANSYVFGMDFFCMGLNERHLKRFNNNRLWSGIIAENLPQIIIQFWFLSLLDWEPSSSIVWVAIVSSSLSIGAALLDIYSAKKLFDVLEPDGVSVGKVSCSMYVLSQEIKEKSKKLQVSTYALRDAIAETLTTHQRSVEMHFPITTADGFKIGFTVFSSKLQQKDIYERLIKNAISTDGKPAELPKKIKKVWRLEGVVPKVPLVDIKVDGIDPNDFEEFRDNLSTKHRQLKQSIDLHEGGDIEMTNFNKKDNGMMGTNNNDNNGADDKISDYDAQMAALNAQIAMNQYLMMQQMEYMQNNNDNDNNTSQRQQLMMQQMQQMNGMINMSQPYDPNSFQQFNNEWEQQRNDYQPPQIPQQENQQQQEQ